MANIILISILLLAVNMSAQVDSVRFAVFGDYGVDDNYEEAVANLVKSWNPDFIITTGDNSYGSNYIDNNIGKYYGEFIGDYVGGFGEGSSTNRFFPCLGNHDYSDGGGISAYLDYFSLPGENISGSNSSGNERYYDFVMGPVHFFALNSNIQEPDGIAASSDQAMWLMSHLALSDATWKIVYFHHPPFSSALHGSTEIMRWPFEDWGVSTVLNGHDHTYERIMRDDNDDTIEFPYFVTGLGGRSPYNFPAENLVDGSQVRYNSFNGSMLIDATREHLIMKFYSIDDLSGTLIDSFKIDNIVLESPEDHSSRQPERFDLGQNIPNPFNASTSIRFKLPRSSRIAIEIYNILGQSVRRLIDEEKPPGQYEVTWDGLDDNGREAASGMYFYRINAGDYSESKKMILMK